MLNSEFNEKGEIYLKKMLPLLFSVLVAFSTLFLGQGIDVSAAVKDPGLGGSSTVRGGYVKSTYYAQGGRVNIEYHDLYLKVSDARKYASKSEVSIKEGAVWFGASFIPTASPYIATIGFYKTSEASLFASNIRKYTDKGQHVHITLSKDKRTGTAARTVKKWDGKKSSIKQFSVPAPKYQKVNKKIYKY